VKITAGNVTIKMRSGRDESVVWDMTRLIGSQAGTRDAIGRKRIAFPQPFADVQLVDGEDLTADGGKRARLQLAIEYFIVHPES
jgi:hypothetical protein